MELLRENVAVKRDAPLAALAALSQRDLSAGQRCYDMGCSVLLDCYLSPASPAALPALCTRTLFSATSN